MTSKSEPSSVRGAGATDDPIYVMRDLEGPHDDLFHLLRNDVILATVYWDAVDCGPARDQGWFSVVNDSEVHEELPAWGPDEWRDALRIAFHALAARGALSSSLSPLQSRRMLFWSITDDDRRDVVPATLLERVAIDLD